MSTNDIDWKILRGSLIVFILTIIVSSSLIYGGYFFTQKMQAEFNRTNVAFMSISNRYLAVDEEEKLIRNFLPRFVGFYNEGVIGKEQRLNWVEVLRDTGEEIKLPSLSYQIDSQQVFTPGIPLTLGKYKLFSSKMSLTMQLLHEGDLFRIFDKLEEDAKGLFSISKCSITPSASSNSGNTNAANINAQCDLDWYTIRLADGQPIEV
ncbi:MAG: hypothetical protein ACI9XC_000006 [Gammaproteobacteria bacterium]|jgi:hypothetical protein